MVHAFLYLLRHDFIIPTRCRRWSGSIREQGLDHGNRQQAHACWSDLSDRVPGNLCRCLWPFLFRVRKVPSLKDPLYRRLRSTAKFRGFLWAMGVSFITIFTRCVYRAVELGGGWNNKLMREELPFIILESWYVRCDGLSRWTLLIA